MIYLDYSATTKTSKNVIEKFCEIEKKFYGNPNSSHKLGTDSKKIIDESVSKMEKLLGIKPKELILTSGASESNNTVLKGLEVSHIITTKQEHSSILTPVGFLQTKGRKVSFVNLDKNGLVDLNHLKTLITNEETLVSIGMVNSEVGIKQNIEEIGKILKKYPNVYFHSDITQALGKVKVNLENIDLASFSFHKINGLKGIGGLIKKTNIPLIPLIHGGKGISIYRSGTPQTSLIASSQVALENALQNVEKYNEVLELNNYLKEKIKKYVIINSNEYSIPHILNISIPNKDSEETVKYFGEKNIFISSKTACSSGNYSLVINTLYNDMKRAETSVRISISKDTTKEELDIFIENLKELVK